MSLFNTESARIAAAQARVLETLAGIPDEYGAAFVIMDYQDIQTGELPVAVREERKRLAMLKAARRMNELEAQKANKAAKKAAALGVVVGLDGKRVA